MDSRKRLVSQVVDGGLSVSAAAREAKVSRQTAHLWLDRAREEGLGQMSERSRRPKRSPRLSEAAVVEQVLGIASEHPYWGPSKLHALLWPQGQAAVCERTVARILARAGRRVRPERAAPSEPVRFERSAPNELWQADFKRAGHRRARKDVFSLIDDAARFCLALKVVPDQTLGAAWGVLWSAFGEFGMPEALLSDNGPAFHCNATWRWSLFDLRLMLLGIRPVHGRPYHPQTQGKVERLHGTIEQEVRFTPTSDVAAELYGFRERYNWVRPHDSLCKRTPGSVYAPSTRTRPKRMPEPYFPEGAIIRTCHQAGKFSLKGQLYKLGIAFTDLPVGLLLRADDDFDIVWGEFNLGPLSDLKVSRMSCHTCQGSVVT